MDEWNPMMADYNDPYFNRYSQGVGRNLLSGNRTTANIFVDNFPVEVGEEGLRNIFSDFGLVRSAELKPSNRPDKRHTYGFVMMADPAAAAEAISVLNGHRFSFSPLSLRVMPAITNEEKERRKINKQIERDIMGPYVDSDTFSLPDDARSRRSFEYNGPSLQRSLLGQYDPRNANMQYGPGWAFGTRGSLLPLGRGRQMAEQFRGRGAPFVGRGQKLLDYISGDPGRGRGLAHFPGVKAPPRVSQAGSCKQCVHCGQEDSVNRCSRCKMYYCSLECQRKDWPNHKSICLDVSLHHQTLYGVDPLTSSIENQKRNLTNGAPGAYPGGNSGQKYDKDTENKRNQPRRKEEQVTKNQSSAKALGNKSKHSSRDQSSDSASLNSRNKENGGKRQNVQSTRNNVNNRGDNQQNESGENNQSSRNVDDSQKKRVNKGKNQSKDERQGDKKEREALKENEGVNHGSRAVNGTADDQRGSGKSYEKTNENRRKIPEEKKSGRSNAVNESGDAPCDLERDTLPFNSEIECYLSFYKNPDMFWVIKKENMMPFLETTQLFTESIRDLPKISASKVKEGDLCCLLYEEEWSRAKVMKIEDNSRVTVIFSDYGNKEVVDMSNLLPLAPEMRQLPAQAIYCCLSGLKPKQSKWSEEASAAVGEWFGEPLTKEFRVTCHAKEGSKFAVEIKCDAVTPNDLKELLLTENYANTSDTLKADVNQNVKKKKDPSPVKKRFQAHELQSVGSELNVGDRININIMLFKSVKHFVGQILDKMTALPELEEMLAKEKLQQDAPYRPAVGEVVLAKYHEDKRWYRSEVVNIKGDTCDIIFIDYGNEESVSSDDIRQISDASFLKYPRFALSFGMQGFEDMNPSQKVLDEFAALLEEYTVQTGVWKAIVLEKRNSLVIVDFQSDTKTESLSEALCKKLSPKKDSTQRVTNKPSSDATSSSPKSPLKSTSTSDSPKSPVKSTSTSGSPKSPVKSTSTSGSPKSPVKFTSSKPKSPVKSSSPNMSRASESTTCQTSCPIQTESLPDVDTALASVTVLYVVDLNNFYVGLSDKQMSLSEMMVELNNSVASLVPMERVQKGSLATVKFEDGLWYRVHVLSVQEDTCSVFFIDYGNTETMKTECLHVLPDLESTTPAQAIQCSLDLKLYQDSTDFLKQLKSLENGEVHVKVLKKMKDVCMLQVCTPDGSDLFQTQKKTEKKTDLQKKKTVAVATPMLSDIEVKEQKAGTDVKVICVFFKDVNEFYCLNVEDIQDVSTLTENLDLYFKSSELDMSQEPIVGGLYACYYESQWYRCVIEEIKSDEVSVKYIDFGNTETRSIADLKPLDHEFLTQPISVIKCKLHGIQILDVNSGGQELEQYNLMLMKQVQVNELSVNIDSKDGDAYLVSLSISSKTGKTVDIASDLVSVGLAKWTDATKSLPLKPEVTEEDDEDEDDEDERKMKELMRQMEEIKLKKKKKTTK